MKLDTAGLDLPIGSDAFRWKTVVTGALTRRDWRTAVKRKKTDPTLPRADDVPGNVATQKNGLTGFWIVGLVGCAGWVGLLGSLGWLGLGGVLGWFGFGGNARGGVAVTGGLFS